MTGERTLIGVLAWTIFMGLGGACGTPGERPYLERRARFQTTLLDPGPTPLEDLEADRTWELFSGDWNVPAERVREIRYRSGTFDLKAWIYTPVEAEASPAPALVYLHPGAGGAAASWIRDTRPFLEAGFVVMLPTFRGEMGNPGNFEFVLGEVDDAKAAIGWLSTQPFVDRARIYAFGWSYGGFVSGLLSLLDDMPLRHSGSSGGLSSPVVLDEFVLPYDRSNPEESQLRSLVGNLHWMKRRHYAYLGSADSYFMPAIVAAKREMSRGPSQLQIIMVPGEHFAAGVPGVLRYFDLIQAEQGKPKP